VTFREEGSHTNRNPRRGTSACRSPDLDPGPTRAMRMARALRRRIAGPSEERTALGPGEAPLSAPADGPKLLGRVDFPEPRQRGAGQIEGRSPRRCRPGSPSRAATTRHAVRGTCAAWAACAGRRGGRTGSGALRRSRALVQSAQPMQRPKALGSERRPVLHCLHRASVSSRRCGRRRRRMVSLHAPNTSRCEVCDATV